MTLRRNAVPPRLLAALIATLCAGSPRAAELALEGHLEEYGIVANGRYDLQLTAFDAATGGRALGAPMTFEHVLVKDGRFRVEFDIDDGIVDRAWVAAALRVTGEQSAFAQIPGRSKAMNAKVGSFWSTTGDAGTTRVNFLGTTDAQPLNLRVQDRRAVSYTPSVLQYNNGPATTTIVAGSSANSISAGAKGSVIAGGGAPSDSDPDHFYEDANRIWGDYSVIGGGAANSAGVQAGAAAEHAFAVISGGYRNAASGVASVVGGGERNTASARFATVGGGYGNTAMGEGGTVGGGGAGGDPNDAIGRYSTVGGGVANTGAGDFSTVTGGMGSCAGGDFSWAGGRFARVRPANDLGAFDGSCASIASSGDADGDNGTFVWADDQSTNFISTGPRQFLVRAQNGVAINANNPQGNALRVNGTVRIEALGIGGTTSLCRNASNQIAACSSSARYKDDIDNLDLGLAAVEQLRPVAYRWKDSHEADVGFVAEEIAALDERLVTRNAKGQIEGVKYDRLSTLLAGAVQELAARERMQSKELDDLRARLARIESTLNTRRD